MAMTVTLPALGRARSAYMKAAELLRRANNKLRLPIPIFRLLNRNKPRFECPICANEGPFLDFSSFAGVRKHAVCPRCGALERHRLQYLVAMRAFGDASAAPTTMLHFAPEAFLSQIFAR